MGIAHITMLAALLAPVSPEASKQAANLAHESALEYDLGHFEEALKHIEGAYLLDPLPGLLFNLGQCHRQLRHWNQAEVAYRGYLRNRPDAPNRALVRELISEVHEQLLRERAARPGPPDGVAPDPFLPEVRGEQAAPAPASPATPLVTVAPPVSVPLVSIESGPEAKPPESHGHAAAYVLGSIAIVGVALAVVGIVEVESFESLRAGLRNPSSYTQYQKDAASVTNQGPGAQTWEGVAIAAGAVALGTGTAAGFVW